MEPFSGNEPYIKAEGALKAQIDKGLPVPALVLNHKDKAMKEYVWHWFLINGYDDGSAEGAEAAGEAKAEKGLVPGTELPKSDGIFRVKALTYSEYEWLEFFALWNTGSAEKGGLVLYSFNNTAS